MLLSYVNKTMFLVAGATRVVQCEQKYNVQLIVAIGIQTHNKHFAHETKRS